MSRFRDRTINGILWMLLCLCLFFPPCITSFTSPIYKRNRQHTILPLHETKGGWEKRPIVPELSTGTAPPSSPTPTIITTTSKAKTDPKPERVPWDGLRFLKQTSQFITMPNPLARFDASKQPVLVNPGDVIWEPNSASNPFAWAPLDDVVMGGASQSGFNAATGIWKGTVTSANNGGFVGIRTTPFSPPLDLRNCQGIELRIQNGNGKRYKAIVRDSTDFNGVCWTSSFDTVAAAPFFLGGKTRPSVIRLPLNKLIPTIFARTVPDQVLNINNIVAFQLAYSKFEYDGKLNSKFELGDFSLQLLEVRAY